MDAVGTTLAILGLIGKITTYTRTASGCRDDRERLRTQLQACENVIHLLQDDCHSDASLTWIQLMNRLAEPGSPLDCLYEALNSVASKLSDGNRLKTALKWPFKKDDVETLMKVVDQNITLLLVALNNDSGRLLHSLNGQSGDQKARTEELTQKVQALGQDGQIQMQTLTDKLSGIEIAHMNIQSGIDRLNSGQEKRESVKQRRNILNWLTKHDHCQQQSYVFSNRLDNTGGWFLRSDQYRKWIQTTGQTLMCQGVPGAGKTILTSIVVEDLRSFSRTEPNVGVAFIYCDYKLRHEQTGDMLLTILLKQLIAGRQTLPESIQELYEDHGQGTSSLSPKDLRATLRSVTSLYRRIIIAVDALDEGEDYHLTTLFSEIFSLQEKFGVNVFATTRPAVTEKLSRLFKGATEIEISAKDEDVQRYVEARMHELPSCISKGRLKDDIKERILDCVDGMFLLAKLHMTSLKDLATAAEIRYAIKNLKQGSDSYESAYETAIQRIRGQSASRTKLANKVLAWIVYAKRVLNASELRLALGVEVGKDILDYDACPDFDMIVSVCAGLVTIDETADTIRLVHYTAQTFFDNAKSTILPSAETDFVRICTAYLSLEIFAKYQHGDGYQSDSPSEGEDEEPLGQNSSNLSPSSGIHNYNATDWGIISRQALYNRHSAPQNLYDYAAQYWGIHARETPDAHEDVMRFLSQRSYVTGAFEVAAKLCGYRYWGGNDENRESTLISVDGLHLAALLGLEKAVEEILREYLYDPDVVIRLKPHERWCNVSNGIGPFLTPLTIAAAQNHPKIVKMLLDSGATLGVVSLDERKKYKGTTPLYVASERGFKTIVDMLLQADVTSHSQRSMGDVGNLQTSQNEQSRTPKLYIGPQKRDDELDRLLQYTPRPNVDSPSVEFCTDGRDKGYFITREYGDTRGASSEDLSLSLYVASAKGQSAIVEKLLHHGAKVDATSKQSPSPLYAACAYGHMDIARKLLQNGASVDAIHKSSSSPLYVACKNGHMDIARKLLQNGASVDAIHKSSSSPLYVACKNGHIDIARMLLQKGASVDAPHGSDNSPLHGAASNGHTEIFKLLLQYGSGVHQLNHNSRISPYLHDASAGGHVEIVKILLEHGAKIHLMKEVLLSPIHATIERGRLEVFNLLINDRANINQLQGTKTPLQLAIDMQQQNGADSTLETMIEQLKELGGMTSRELRLQETRELMLKRRKKNASSAEQQEPVDLLEEHS